jgi:hypothetical protein
MAVANYAELAAHIEHTLEIVIYGGDANAAIECINCDEILFDYDNTEENN